MLVASGKRVKRASANVAADIARARPLTEDADVTLPLEPSEQALKALRCQSLADSLGVRVRVIKV